MRTNCNDDLVDDSDANVACNLVIYPGEKHRRGIYHTENGGSLRGINGHRVL